MESPRLPPLSRSEATSPKGMRLKGRFGVIRIKRKTIRDTPPRLLRAVSDDTLSPGPCLPSLKERQTLPRDSKERVVLRHFQLDESLLNNSSESGSDAEEDLAPDTVRSQPSQFSYSANTSIADWSSRLKLSKPVEIFWQKKHGNGNAPSTREGATWTTVNRKFYLFGGECRTLLNDIRVLSPETLKWEAPVISHEGDPPPEPRSGHSAVCYRNSVVIFGGAGSFNNVLKLRKCYNRLHLYDTVTKKWTTAVTNGHVPQVRRNHAAAVVGTTMLMYGGLDEVGNVLDDLVGLNLESFRWFAPRIHKTCLLRPGKRHSLSFIPVFSYSILRSSYFDLFHIPYVHDDIFTKQNSGIYLFGGQMKGGQASNDLFILKPKPVESKDDDYYMKWVQPEISGQPPEGRYAYSAALRGKYVAFFGGRNDQIKTGGLAVRDIALLNIECMRWERVLCHGMAPTSRWGCCLVTYQSKMIVFGGMRAGRYCSGKLFIAETDPRVASEQKLELEYIQNIQEQVGRNAFERVAKATMIAKKARSPIADVASSQGDDGRESIRG